MRPCVVVLTGAGISAESGLGTFRGSADGLWEGHRKEDVATPEGFQRDPATVQRFYNTLRSRLHDPDVQPTAAHHALVRLEEFAAPTFHLVTQNIDDLHQRAGSSRITALHGEPTKARHVRTGHVVPCGGNIPEDSTEWRPHVVWFGEPTVGMPLIRSHLTAADLFIAVGTSGVVYPANLFVAIAKHHGALTINVDIDPAPNAAFDLVIAEPAATAVPRLVDEIIAGLQRPH